MTEKNAEQAVQEAIFTLAETNSEQAVQAEKPEKPPIPIAELPPESQQRASEQNMKKWSPSKNSSARTSPRRKINI